MLGLFQSRHHHSIRPQPRSRAMWASLCSKAHLFSVLQGEEYLRIAAVKELLGQKFLGGDDLVGHLFIRRQRPDEGEDQGRVLPDGKAKRERRHAQSSAL